MTDSKKPLSTTTRALRQLGLLWGGALIAATTWAAGIQEDGYMLAAQDWRAEVAGAPSPDWPVDAWYRLTPSGKSIEVRAMTPSDPDDAEPEGAIYVRVPGTRLKEGMRATYRFSNTVLRPKVGHQYELLLGKTRFAFAVESGENGTQYAITYGGVTHNYVLGLPAAATRVHAIADLDGDAMPDFLVEVGDETFLLLSTKAQAGDNPPSAQLWAMSGC
ncbi:MAG: hypothetical protein V4792_18260 [Pseudomonadota bacterium]